MKNYFFSITACLVCSVLTTNAQVIPDSLRVNWSAAGYSGLIPDPREIISVKNFGAYGDGIHDDYNAILSAIHSSANFRVIFFPAGNYLIKSPISLDSNIVLRGEGEATNLLFDLSQITTETNCIEISGKQTTTYTAVNSGYYKGSTSLIVSVTKGYVVNGYAEIKETNGPWAAADNYPYVGQIVKIKSINGNRLEIEPALRINYTDSLKPRIKPIVMKENVGIECLKITRLDPPVNDNSGHNISFLYANNCWVTGVESIKCQTTHICLASCSHITVSGCYFHDAFTYDGGGQAYGVSMHSHTSDCKVENCIFRHLRHAMIAAGGANGNVYGYNYSIEPTSTTEIPRDHIGDMSLHGHYAYANLFEGNICQNMIIDDYWGPSGPYNTFFRNRAELYGIEILDDYGYAVKSDRQNLVANEVTNTTSMKGNYFLAGSNHFTYDNNIKGSIQPSVSGAINDMSYYLSSKPYFWNIAYPWPSMGGSNRFNTGTNPAKERYLSKQAKTICLKEPASPFHAAITADSISCNGDSANIILSASGGREPYVGTGVFKKAAGSYSFVVADAFGVTDTLHITLTAPAIITASYTSINANACEPLSGGVVVKDISGGIAPFQYSLNGSDYTGDPGFHDLHAGSYNLAIRDSRGCKDSIAGILITQAEKISAAAKTTMASICRDDGSITIENTSGGISPYQYSLDGIDYRSEPLFNHLSAGDYNTWIKDSSGCIDSITGIVITRPEKISASVKTTMASTCHDVGSISIENNTGGIWPYQYSLDGNDYGSEPAFNNLPAGDYDLWIKDSSGCVDSITGIIITHPEKISASVKTTMASACHYDGTITIENTSGGIGPYQYSLNENDYSSEPVFNNLAAGYYSLWIKDSSGCVDSITGIRIEETAGIAITAKTTLASSCTNDGSITIKRTGGLPPFTYSLNNIDYTASNIFSSLAPGSYTAWVKDNTGCTSSATGIVIKQAAALKASVSKTNVTCKNAADGTITITAKGGISPYSYSLDSLNFTATSIFTNLKAGSYNARVKDSRACISVSTVNISNTKTTCSTTGVSNLSGSNFEKHGPLLISVSPNPSSATFRLTVNTTGAEPVYITVTDVYGRTVYHASGAAGKSYEFGKNFIPGVYMVQSIQGNAMVVARIIKQ